MGKHVHLGRAESRVSRAESRVSRAIGNSKCRTSVNKLDCLEGKDEQYRHHTASIASPYVRC